MTDIFVYNAVEIGCMLIVLLIFIFIYLQGYKYSKPIAIEELEQFLGKQ